MQCPVIYQSVSGMWYHDIERCDDVSAVRINGEVFTNRNAVLDEAIEEVEGEMHEDLCSFDSLIRKLNKIKGES